MRPPAPPSSLAPGIPEPLDALVLSLLAHEPNDRPGDADVVAALSAANASNAAFDQGKIDALDKQWRAEVGAAENRIGRDSGDDERDADLGHQAAASAVPSNSVSGGRRASRRSNQITATSNAR